MKISKSKQELARIISENGGWCDGAEWAVCGHGCIGTKDSEFVVSFFCGDAKPSRLGENYWSVGDGDSDYLGDDSSIHICSLIKNWHQTILSRDEYFHLYPSPDAKPEFCESVMRSIPEPETKPTIEQLATDYRNAKDYADRKQQEADAAKADAEAKLKALELAGEEIGLIVSPITTKQEPELVITDWRDLLVGDEIECVSVCLEDNGLEMFEDDKRHHGKVCRVIGFEYGGINHINTDIDGGLYIQDFKFIRRP